MEIFRGTIVRYKGKGFELLRDGVVIVENGKITMVKNADEMYPDKKTKIIKFRGRKIAPTVNAIVPPTANMHDHSFQPPGIPGELIYLDKKSGKMKGWLPETLKKGEYKAKNDHDAAEAMIRYKLKKFASHGTGTLLQYATSSVKAVETVLKAADKTGIRVIAGYVCMDQGIEGIQRGLQTPPDEAVKATETLLKKYGPEKIAVIDRFPIAVSSGLRKRLAEMARHYGALYETHMDESCNEKNLHKSIYGTKSIAGTLVRDGLFAKGGRIGLAHAIHTTGKEIEMIGTKINEGCKVHIRACPNSNGQLASHFDGTNYVEFPLVKWQQAGALITLGTDQGAGRGWNIFDEMLDERTRHPLPTQPAYTDLLKFGTLNGHLSAGVDIKKTNIAGGNRAEFIIVEMAGAGGFYNPGDTPKDLETAAARIIEGAAFGKNILKMYVNGKKIF